MVKLHQNQKTIQKTYLLLCLLIIFVVLISFIIQITTTLIVLQKNTRELLHASHQQSYDNISNYLTSMEDTIYSLCYNTSVQNYFHEEDPYKQLIMFKDLQAAFSSIIHMHNDVLGFSLYDKDGTYLTANAGNHQNIILLNQIEPSMEISYDSLIPPNDYIGISNTNYVMQVPIMDTSAVNLGGSVIGTVVVTMSHQYIDAQVNSGNSLKGNNHVLVDALGNIIAGSGYDIIPVTFPEEEIANNFVIVSEFKNTGWRFISSLEAGSISEDLKLIWQSSIFTAMTIILLITVFIILLQKRILHPIDTISRFMHKVTRDTLESNENNSLRYTLTQKESYVEFAQMEESMNHMLAALQEKTDILIQQEKKYYEAVLAGNHMEIIAYRNQINPHFLYNTLDCIRGIAFSHNAKEIVEITQSLSYMFRYAVKGKNNVTVEEEMEHLREYRTIIKHRFLGRISITVSADEASLNCSIPGLVLQPIVENAVFHGLEKQMGQGEITVRIFLSNNMLHIQIADNGIGMDAETLSRLNQQLQDASTYSARHQPIEQSGIGLMNIAHRLRLFNTKSCDMTVRSKVGNGTIVEIQIEAEKEEA